MAVGIASWEKNEKVEMSRGGIFCLRRHEKRKASSGEKRKRGASIRARPRSTGGGSLVFSQKLI